jgi:hypothetical protein
VAVRVAVVLGVDVLVVVDVDVGLWVAVEVAVADGVAMKLAVGDAPGDRITTLMTAGSWSNMTALPCRSVAFIAKIVIVVDRFGATHVGHGSHPPWLLTIT